MDIFDDLIKHQEFRPTPAMFLYAFQRAKAGKKAKDSMISKAIGVRAETISRWKHINGFEEWLEEQVASYRAPILALLEQVALDKIRAGDFRFWQSIGKKYGFINDSPVVADTREIYSNPTISAEPDEDELADEQNDTTGEKCRSG